MENIESQLEQLGLNKKEAKIYVASLKNGSAPLTVLARQAGIKRPTAYYIVESLIAKGLMIKVPHGRRTYYRTELPSKLGVRLEEQRKLFTSLEPQLTHYFRISSKLPVTQLFESKRGIASVYEQMFSTSKTIYALMSADDFYSLFSERDNESFFRLLRQSGGYLYDMLLAAPRATRMKSAEYRKGVSKTKILPPSFHSPVDVLVVGDKVALISFTNQIAVVIEDASIALAQKNLLQFLWKHA